MNFISNRFREAASAKAQTTTPQPEESVKEPSIKLPGLDNLRNAPKLNRLHNSDRESGSDFQVHKPVAKPNVVFKSFDRFSRPDTRKSLLEKILGKGKGENTLDPEQVKQEKLEKEFEKELDEEKTTQSFIDSNDVVDESDELQTTLHVSTLFPSASSSVFLEVATIRSPYSFDFEDGKSTR